MKRYFQFSSYISDEARNKKVVSKNTEETVKKIKTQKLKMSLRNFVQCRFQNCPFCSSINTLLNSLTSLLLKKSHKKHENRNFLKN